MNTEQGIVQNVIVRRLGDVLAADIAIGAVSLTLVDAAEFSEDGGQLSIDGELLTFDSCNDETGVVTLSTATTAAHLNGTEVYVEPEAWEKTAVISIDAAEETVEANVPYNLWDRMPEGTRTTEAEQVLLDVRDDSFELIDVLGIEPVVEGSFVDVSTIDPLPQSALVNMPPVSPDNIGDGTYTGDMLVTGALTTRAPKTGGGRTGPGQDLGQQGFFSYGPLDVNGLEQQRVAMPTDPMLPHVFRGQAFIDKLTVSEFITLATSSLAEGAVMTMLVGMQAPTNAPTVSFEWNTVTFPDAAFFDERIGLAYDTAGGYYVLESEVSAHGSSQWYFSLTHYNASGVVLDNVIVNSGHGTANGLEPRGVATDGTYLFILTGVFNSKGVFQEHTISRFLIGGDPDVDVTRSSWGGWVSGDGKPGIGFDTATGDVLIAYNRDALGDVVSLRRYTFVPGGSISLVSNLTSNVSMSTVQSVLFTSADFGIGRWVIGNLGKRVVVISSSTGFEVTTESFGGNTAANQLGIVWNGTTFVSAGQDGQLTFYETNANLRWTSTTQDTWHAAYAPRTSTGVYITQRSAVATFSGKKRARLRITGYEPPMGGSFPPDQVRFYLYRGSTVPTAGTMFYQADVTAAAGVTAQLLITAPDFATATKDSTTNTYPNGAASKLMAALSGFNIDAVSNGSVGTGTFRDSAGQAATRCVVHNSAAFTVPNTTDTLLAFNTEDYDPDGMHSSGLFTATKTGTWRITLNGQFAQDSTGRRVLHVNRNSATSTTNLLATITRQPVAAEVSSLDAVVLLNLTAGDVIRLWVWQNTGASLTYGGPGAWPLAMFELVLS